MTQTTTHPRIMPTEHPYIMTDDRILGGEPIVKDTRTPVRAIVEIWRLGTPPKIFPITCHICLWDRSLMP